MLIKDQIPEHWRLGVFYYNPEQPRVFVAKRYGGPLNLNFARPLAWVIAAIPLAVATVGALVHIFHRGH